MKKNKWIITVNGDQYPISGEEPQEYLIRVGLYFTDKLESLKGLQAHYKENMLPVMAGLTITDELFREREKVARLEARVRELESKFEDPNW